MWYEMRPKKEFRDPNYDVNNKNGTWDYGLDKTKITIDAPMDMSMYEFCNNRTGEVISYDVLLDRAVATYNAK